ncbi:MAG: BMC domain-containing protein [Spirochaetaceae bacterium]
MSNTVEGSVVLGGIELDSVAAGAQVLDTMAKKAPLRFLDVRTVCPGKYVMLFTGDEASVEAALTDGVSLRPDCVLNWIYIPTLHHEVWNAVAGDAGPPEFELDAVGILESFSVLGAVEAGDAAAKAAGVTVVHIRSGDEMGGKSSLKLVGPLAEVEAALTAGAKVLEKKDTLCKQVIIPRPHEDLGARLTKG